MNARVFYDDATGKYWQRVSKARAKKGFRRGESVVLCAVNMHPCGVIRGFSQGDWQKIIYDATRYSEDEIDYIEAVYFGTATEWTVVETERVCNSTDDIWDEYYNGDGYCTLTISDAKEELSKATGISEDDITLYYISGYRQVPKYELVV